MLRFIEVKASHIASSSSGRDTAVYLYHENQTSDFSLPRTEKSLLQGVTYSSSPAFLFHETPNDLVGHLAASRASNYPPPRQMLPIFPTTVSTLLVSKAFQKLCTPTFLYCNPCGRPTENPELFCTTRSCSNTCPSITKAQM